MNKLSISILAALSLFLIGGCGDSDTPHGPTPTNTFTMTCPPDTILPISESTDPDSTGLFPIVSTNCMDEANVSYTDSMMMAGGFIRIWIASDTCGNADTCLQSIGLGAPVFTLVCPNDTVIPINCPIHPDSLGLYPQVYSNCMIEVNVNYIDSSITGGIRRTWIASDTCGNADTCLQAIGLGAPGTCN